MRQVLSKVFRARPGEWAAVLLLQLLVFLIICILLIVKPTASALFLSEFGADGLPYIFLGTAILAAIVSWVYSVALRRYSLLRVSMVSLLVCLGILLACDLFIQSPPARPAVAATLYLWTAIFGVLAASQFWMMASFVFDLRQAKRLFGLIGAGAIAGGIAGGYLTNLLAREIGARNLILLAAALIVPCLVLTAYIWRRFIAQRQSAVRRKKQSNVSKQAPHRLIFGSRYLLLLCAIVAISVTVAKLVDYQFSALAAERYGDQDRLAAFFGFWYSTFNIVALVIQLLLTQRVVQGLGVSGAMLFLPAGLGLGVVVMLFMPGLSAATFSRAVDGSLKQSLGRASMEMLFLPLAEETKKKVKTYIDVFIDSLAGGVGGLLLIAVTQVLHLSVPQISYVIIVLVCGWLVAVVLIREEYIDAFRAQLSHLKPKKQRNRLRSHHRKVMASFLQVLEEGQMSTHEKQLLYVLERTDKLGSRAFREPIRKLLSHPSANVRARALRSLYLQPGNELLDEVLPRLADEDGQVRAAAFDYLFSRSGGVREGTLEGYLQHPDADIAGTALVSLASETAGNAYSRRRWGVERRLRQRIRNLRSLSPGDRQKWTLHLLRASGRSNTRVGRHFIERCLLHDDERVVRFAILAAGESQHEDLIVPLLHLLTEATYRPLAISALVQYGGGLTGLLPRLISTGKLSLDEVRKLPTVLERIDRQQSVYLLFECMQRYYPHDLPLRTQAIRALNAVRRDFPDRKFPAKAIYRLLIAECRALEAHQYRIGLQEKLLLATGKGKERKAREELVALLHQREEGSLNRMFRLLGLRYPPADIIPVHLALKSQKRSIQISAIEFLDNLLELSLKRTVIPLLDQYHRRYHAEGFDLHPGEESSDELSTREIGALRRILKGPDRDLKLAALRLIETLRRPDYLSVLREYLVRGDQPPPLRDRARKALDKMEEQLAGAAL
jgi:AAA family ATP:ADP antiporter